MAGFWVLAAMILVNSYSGTVISFLTLEKYAPPIRTMEDLSRSPKVELLLRKDAALYERVLVIKMY